MKKCGDISEEEYQEAMADDVYDRIQTTNETKSSASVYSYYVDATIAQVINDLQEVKGDSGGSQPLFQ